MIYVGALDIGQGHSEAERVALAIANNVALTLEQEALLVAELEDEKYTGLGTPARLVELSKSTYGAGQMPRPSCESDDFMVVRNRAAKAASSPGATAEQQAVWAQLEGASLGMGFQDSVDLTLPDVRGGLDACYAVGLISEADYLGLIWQDSVRTAGWVERTFGPGYVLMPSDLEGLS